MDGGSQRDLFTIVESIVPTLERSNRIHAMWIEGSWATRSNTESSDIDVWLDIEDGTFGECVELFRRALEDTGKIDWEASKGIYSEQPKLYKHTFHLLDFPIQQRIEVDLQEHSRRFIFDPDLHTIIVLIDKGETIKWNKEQNTQRQ